MKFCSPKCASLTPYVCGEQPQDKQYIKLNTNENPYSFDVAINKAISLIDSQSLRLYPDPDSNRLKQTIADKYNISKENVFVSNGSDEALSLVYSAFFDPCGKGIATADITYSFYPVYSDYYSIPTKVIPLSGDMDIVLDDYDNLDVSCFLICNPNAPTGKIIDKDRILRFIKEHSNQLIVIDEAYSDFADYNLVEFIKEYDNLLIVRTFSKSYSLAGLRIGYVMGNKELIKCLDTVKNSFNSYPMDRIAESIACSVMSDEQTFQNNRNMVVSTRKSVIQRLRNLGFLVLDSQANFIFCSHNKVSGFDIYTKLRQEGILVRHWNKAPISNFVRITIGTDIECDKLIETIMNIVNNG